MKKIIAFFKSLFFKLEYVPTDYNVTVDEQPVFIVKTVEKKPAKKKATKKPATKTAKKAVKKTEPKTTKKKK